MDKNFVIPATTFLSGFFLWLVFIILHALFDAVQDYAVGLDIIVCFLTGGLIVYSGISCKLKGGPRIGAIVRTIVLFVLAMITFWRMGWILLFVF